jgi:1A family penicillin-binding protein
MAGVIKKEVHAKQKKRLKLLFGLSWKMLIVIAIIIGGLYWFFIKDLPSPTGLSSSSLPKSTHIYDRNGKLLYTIYSNKNQSFTPISKIPKDIQHATIAIEDKDFYHHGAVDLRGIVRAGYATLVKKDLQGGSTLTQQLVKTSLLTPERTIERKIKEVLLSFATEALYSKDQILEMYLNQVPYGGTAYGVEAAAQTYFGKSAAKLTLAESALLAGLPESPSVYSPFGSHPELAKQRQEEVLLAMKNEGYITQQQMEKAIKQPLTYQRIATDIKAPHFVFYVKDLLIKKYGAKKVEQGGLNVKTSLDLDLQNYVQASVSAEIAKLKSYKVGNGAVLVTKPGTGEILAMIGSKDYFNAEEDGNVNVTTAHRQPGSSIKPINYAVGLIKGYTAATPFIDKATCYPQPGQKPYCPKNYDNRYHGVMNMRTALGNSINTSAVQMLKMNGIDAMIATASAMGITTFTDPDRYGLSLTLGGGEVTMTDMATAYGVFANGGYRVDLHPILKITDNKGKVVEEYKPLPSPIFAKRVLPPGVAYIISHILLDNNARTLAFGPNSELRIGNKPISVKTGTTNDYRDNWTIGYTTKYLVAVWVGNNDNTPMQGVVSGVTGAAPIWHDIMAHLTENEKVDWPQRPANVVGRNVCANTGTLPSADNPCQTRFEFFIKGIEPKKGNPITKKKIFIDKGTGQPAAAGQTENVEEKEETVMTDGLGNTYCISCPVPPSPSPTP